MTRLSGYGSVVLLAALGSIGLVKDGLGLLPIDATLLVSSGVLVYSLGALITNGFRISAATNAVLAVFWVLFFGIVGASLTGYSASKVGRLFSLTLLAALAPTLLVRDNPTARRFLNALAVIGTVGFVAVEAFGTETGVEVTHTKLAGPLLVWTVVLAVHRQIRLSLSAMIVLPILTLMASYGNRGPLAAVAVALALVLFQGRTKLHHTLMVGSIVVFAAISVVRSAPDIAPERVNSAPGRSTETRLPAYTRTLPVIIDNPLGIGWGDWGRKVDVYRYQNRQYPHNIVLEVFSEAGWLVGVVFVVVLCWLVNTARKRRTIEARGIYGLLLYALVNALVSGDINGNRLLFLVGGIVVAQSVPGTKSPTSQSSPSGHIAGHAADGIRSSA